MLYNIDMDMFVALADPTRRSILELLASSGELSATAICEHFSVSPQAISQHLKTLRRAGLVRVRVDAQRRIYELDFRGIDAMSEWVMRVRRTWAMRLDRLEVQLKQESDDE